MNLHAIAGPAVSVVNPTVFAVLRLSAGYSIAADGTQIPAYVTCTGQRAQVQALTYSDLMKLGSMNVQGTRRAVYLYGNVEGVDRGAIKGGDLIDMPPVAGFQGPTTWLVAQVLEHFPGWTKVAATLQVPS